MSKRLICFTAAVILLSSAAFSGGLGASSSQAKSAEAVQKVVLAASRAMGTMKSFEFHFLSSATGVFAKTTPRMEGTVRVVPGPAGHPPKVLVEAMAWDLVAPGSSGHRVVVTSAGDLSSALDESTRTLWRGASHQGGGLLLYRKSNMFIPTLTEARNIEGLLEDQGELKAAVTSGGTSCDVIFFPLAAGGGYTYRFGRTDHLPRSIEWASSKDGVPGTRTIEISHFASITPPADSAFQLTLPEGYTEKQFTLGGPAVGDKAPAWTVTDDRKNTLSLASLAGNVVVMDFWATWCGPCEASIPHMQALARELRDKPVKVIGLTWNERGDARAYSEKHGVTYPTFPGDALADAYGINSSGIPTVFVIGHDGRVVEFLIGYSGEATDRILREAVLRALAAIPRNRR